MTTSRSKGSSPLTIGRLAKAAGVHVETVRYYQRRGLLEEPNRQPGTHRQYPASALERLGLIKRAQHFGFSLDEIRQLIRLADARDGTKVLAIAEARRSAMRERAQQLAKILRALDRVIGKYKRRKSRGGRVFAELLLQEADPD